MNAANEITDNAFFRFSTDQLERLLDKVSNGVGDQIKQLDTTTMSSIRTMEKAVTEMNGKMQTVLDMQQALAEYVAKTNPSDSLQRLQGMTTSNDAKLSNIIDLQRWLIENSKENAGQIQELRLQAENTSADLRLYVDSQSSSQAQELQGLQSNTSKDLSEMRLEMQRSRVQANVDSRTVLGEIARIQKCLNVEYIAVQISQLSQNVEEEMAMMLDPQLSVDAPKRVRDIATEVDKNNEDQWAQTDPVKFEKPEAKKKKPPPVPLASRQSVAAFSGAEALRKKAKDASMKPPYNVMNYYHDFGIAQKIAKSSAFEWTSLSMVVANALWIAIDTDMNQAALIIDAEPVFVIAENLFCTFFLFEIIIRFLAFQRKRNCLRDGWFVFDSILAFLMVGETWILLGILVALNHNSLVGLGATFSTMRLIRLARLARLSRIARLLRAIPELLIIVKALKFAARSVAVFFLMWGMIIYAFAVMLRQLTVDQTVGEKYFSNMWHAMDTLLLHGIFPESAAVLQDMVEENYMLWPIMVFFAALVSLTTMYMLVGVLVDIVGLVATTEKESLQVSHLAGLLRAEFQRMGHKPEDMHINQHEFQNLLLEPQIMRIMQDVGVDVVVLADMLDLICEDIAKKQNGILAFEDLVELVLSMRGTNAATVKDSKEQIRMNKIILKKTMDEYLTQMKDEFAKLKYEIGPANDDDEEDEDASPSKTD